MNSPAKILMCGLAIAVVAVCAVPAFVSAQDGSGAASVSQTKVAVVDRKKVFDDYEKQKTEYAKLEAEVEGFQEQLNVLETKVKEAREKYDQEAGSMSPAERDRLEEQITSDANTWKAEFKRLEAEMKNKERRLINRSMEEIDAVIRKMGEEGGWDLILEGGSRSGVLFFAEKTDLTDEVTKHLNGSSN